MAAKHQVTSLADYKRELLARSEVYRQTLVIHSKELQNSVSWVPKTVGMAKTAAPLMALGLPLLGMFLFKRKKAAPVPVPKSRQQQASKRGLVAMVLGGIELYNRFKPLLTVLAQHRASSRTAPQRTPTAATPVR